MVLAAVINTERATFPLGQKNAVHVTQYAFSLKYIIGTLKNLRIIPKYKYN